MIRMPMTASFPFHGDDEVHEKVRLLTVSRVGTTESVDATSLVRARSSENARVSRDWFSSGDQKNENCEIDRSEGINRNGRQTSFPLPEHLFVKKEVAPTNVSGPISETVTEFTPFLTCKSEAAIEHGETAGCHRNLDSPNHRVEMNVNETYKVEDLSCHVVHRAVDTPTNYAESNYWAKTEERLSVIRQQSRGFESTSDSFVDVKPPQRRRSFSSVLEEIPRPLKRAPARRSKSADCIWSSWNGIPDVRHAWELRAPDLDEQLSTTAPRCDVAPGDGVTDHVTISGEMTKLKKESELWLQSTDQSDVIWERGGQSPSFDDGGHGKGSRYPVNYATPPQDIGRDLTTWSGDLGDAAYLGQRCVVCGEVANGNFFGAVVCLPCKSFFIRCTKDGEPCILQQCHGQCDIQKQLRNRCQYCRYQQCLAVGMSRREKPECIQPQDGQELCRVCGDLANGIHFGVYTCEGCKKFFRRGLKEQTTYVCKDEKSCRLNPRNRNNCRYCRYQKCLTMGMSREAIKMGRPRKLYPSRQMDHAVSSTTQPQGMFPSYNNNYTRAHDSPLPATDRQNIATRDYCEQLTNTRESGLWMTREMKRPEFPVNSSSSSYVDTSYHRVTSQPARLPQSHNANLHVPMSRMGQFNDLDPISANQSSTMFNHSHPAREVLRNSAPGSSMPHQMLTLPPHQRVAPNPPNVPYNSLPPHRRGNNDSRSTESRHSLSLQAQHRFSHSTRNGLTVNNAVDNVALNHSTNHHRAYTAHPHRGPEVIPHPHLGPEVIPHPHFGLEVIPHLHHGPGARSEERQRMPKLVQMSRDMVSNKTLDQRVTPRGGHGDAWNTNKPLSSASYPPMPPPTGRGRQGLNRSRSPEMGSEEPRYESCEPSVLDLRISSKSRHKDIQPADSSDYIVNEILKSTSGFTSYNSLKRTHVTVEETKQQIYPFKITKLDNGSHSFPAHSIKRPCNTIGHHSSHLVPHGSSHDAACTSGRHAEMVIKSEITDDQSQPHTGTSTNDVAMLPQTTTFHQNTDHSKHNLSLLPSDRYNHANRPTSNCPNQQGPTSHCPNQQGPRTYCIYPCDPSDPSYISHQIITSFVPSSYTSTPATRKSTESSKYTSGLSAFAAGLSQPANGLGRSLIPVVSPPAKPSLQLDGARATVNHPNTEDVQASSSSGGSHGNQGDEPPREQQSSHDRFDPYTNEQTLVYINEMFLVVDTLTDTSLSSSQNLLKGKSTSELDAIDNMFTNIYGYSPLKVNHFWRSLFSYMPRGTTERWQGVLTSRQEEWLKDVTNNYANQVVACDEELNPPTVDTNKCELWPVRGEDTDHWKHFQERVARQTYAEAQFVLKLPDIEEIHPKDRVKLGNNTRLFGNTILMASKEWFDPVRKKFKFFWNWKLPQDHPLCPFRNRIIKTGSRIFNLHMDRTEVALLSALNIMSPENATFQNLPSIWDYTHTLMKILGHYLSTINVDPDDRIPELLSVMPKVRHMSMWYSNLIRNMRADPSSMDKTLQDLTKTAGKLSTTDCNVSTIGCKYSTTECKDLKSMTQSN